MYIIKHGELGMVGAKHLFMMIFFLTPSQPSVPFCHHAVCTSRARMQGPRQCWLKPFEILFSSQCDRLCKPESISDEGKAL